MHSKYIVVAVLILFSLETHSQKIKPLGVGDDANAIDFNNLINYKQVGVKLADFKGKAVIIDFWATWCSPCVNAFFKMDTLQNIFKNSLQFIPVTYEDRETVSKLFKAIYIARGLTIPMTIVDDTVLLQYFSHRQLPHYVWIDSKGIVKAITGPDEVNEKNIQKLVNGNDLTLRIKTDTLKWVVDKPMFIDNQFKIENEQMYYSIITGYNPNLPTGSHVRRGFISFPNHNIVRLYQLILGKFTLEYLDMNRLVLEEFNSMDSLNVGIPATGQKKVMPEFLYTYELYIADTTIRRSMMFEFAKQDLNRFFSLKGYTGFVEKRTIPVLALVRTSRLDKITSKGGKKIDKHSDFGIEQVNFPLSTFISKFQTSAVTNNGSIAVVDNTGFKSNVDISIQSNLKAIDQVNNELMKYDLKFVKELKEVDMIVIKKIK